MLDKRLQLGGLQVGGPRTTQSSARFRVADNVYQTIDNYMIPRFDSGEYLSGFEDSPTSIISLHRYKDRPVIMGTDGFQLLLYDNSTTRIPAPYILASAPPEAIGIQSVEKLGCLYYKIPGEGLYKYDGVQTYKAGVPLPYFGCPQYSASGTTFVRVIQHHIDFQGNIVNSGYVEFPCTPTVGQTITLQTAQSATDLIKSQGQNVGSNIEPKIRPEHEQLGVTYDSYYAVINGSPFIGSNYILCNTGGNHNLTVGAYVLFSASYTNPNQNGLGGNKYALAVALKVQSFTGSTATFSLTDVRYLTTNYEWKSDGVIDPGTFGLSILSPTHISNYWFSIWTSNASTGAYVFKTIFAVPYLSTIGFYTTFSVQNPTVANKATNNTAFNLTENLSEIYDVTSLKQCFPPYDLGYSASSFSTYNNLAIISYENEIYFSDTTLGGSFEMTNGLAFVSVGEGDDGNIQSICGNSDFMIVSRQFKNYYVSGNLVTGNYRVQEITRTSLGAYSNESTFAIEDKIVLFNNQGIWAIYGGGKCVDASETIKGFFENYSNTTVYPEENFFNISSFPTYANISTFSFIRIRFDIARNLLFFMSKGDGEGQLLVLNMSNGEWYTWHGMNYGQGYNPDIKDILFIDGKYYVTSNTDDGKRVFVEDKTSAAYMADSSYRPVLKTTWFTAGEPSMEKKINQIKLWGIVEGSISVSHCLDWLETVYTTDDYTNATSGIFSHKKRLKPANALACSVALSLNTTKFELEGLELEFQSFQESMKK